jgi:predicted aspartyl protease
MVCAAGWQAISDMEVEMRRLGWMAAFLLAGAGFSPQAPALAAAGAGQAVPPASAGPDVDAMFEAAARGELAPIEHALAAPLPADVASLLRARLAASRYDLTAAADPALARLAAGRDPALRRAALSVLAGAAFANEDYAEAARAGRLLEEALRAAGRSVEADATGRTWRLAALLAGRPRQRLAAPPSPASIAARRDPVGMNRIDMVVNGAAQDAVIDTGAGFSVLSAETARRLGIVPIEGGVDVGNSVDSTVPVRVGIADRLEIAGVVLRNVPFLIIEDEALSFALPTGRYEIKAILGLPVLRALGRVRIEADRFSVLAPAPAGTGEAQNMHGFADELYVDVALGGRPVALLLDTGANRTSLTARYATANRAAVAALATRNAHTAGAGGARVQPVANWTDAPVSVGGQQLVLPVISITLPAEGTATPQLNGVLGQDVLRRFESYTLDFARMRLSLGAPVATAAAR